MRYLITIPPADYTRICALYPNIKLVNPFIADAEPLDGAADDASVLRVVLDCPGGGQLGIAVRRAWCQPVAAQVRAAAEEVMAILARHDLAGAFIIGDAHFTEVHYRLDPTWSIAKLTDAGELRVRAIRSEYPSAEAQINAISATAAMFIEFERLCGEAQKAFQTAVALIGSKFKITHAARHYRG